jgi:uncharacterized protein
MTETNIFPENRLPLADSSFSFSCHAGVSCFTTCCRNVDLILYPFDLVRLKSGLQVTSADILNRYTRLVSGDNPYFPTVMMRLTDAENNPCPFLSASGCEVYRHRPTACRTYPLERAVDRRVKGGHPTEYYFLTRHDYCKGHNESKAYTVREYIRSQFLDEYNTYNDLWAQLDTLFRTNPWKGEGMAGKLQQLAFMVCFDIDGFRVFSQEYNLLTQMKLTKVQRRAIDGDDGELLKFGFNWLQGVLTGKISLKKG